MSSTISQLASRLRLSKGTVSRILNHKGEAFSEETRQRVFAAADETGYKPHPVARALATGRTGFVGLWVENLSTPYLAQVAHEMEDRLQRNGYDVFITLQAKPEQNPKRTSFFPPILADGIIAHQIFGSVWKMMYESLSGRMPIITTGVWVPEEHLDYVQISLMQASTEAILHLIASGRKRIAYLTDGLPRIGIASDRYDAYRLTMEENGLPQEYILTGRHERANVRQAVRAYFEEKGCPEAIFCHNDDAAITVYKVASEMGIRIPADLALVGCDGIQETEYLPCPITTIVQPLAAMCDVASRFMECRLAEPNGPPQRLVLPAELVIRESSGS